MKWFLIIWLGSPSNFAVYGEFNTFKDCVEKQTMVNKALTQANSKMQTECKQKL